MKNAVKIPETMCPYCGSTNEPVPTKEHLDEAIFNHGSRHDARHVAKNPCMCPDCFGVGGHEDFTIEHIIS